jgi:hypothetical protein
MGERAPGVLVHAPFDAQAVDASHSGEVTEDQASRVAGDGSNAVVDYRE